MSTWSRIANVFRRAQVDRDIDEEIRSHLEEVQAEGRDVRKFGSSLRARAVCDQIIATWLESLLADAAFGWRQLLKHRTASAAAIVSLALGIGACTAAFRLIDALFLRPLPIADPGSLYALSYEADLDGSGTLDIADPFGYPEFRRLRAAVRDQAELMAISYSSRIDITYGSDLEMEKLHRQYVSGWMFSEFGDLL